MSDPYAETDEWPTPAPQQSASGSTVTGDAEGAREARYAEAIHEAQYGCGCGHPNSRDRKSARAVMAVADEEQAALRAEVERVRREGLGWAEEWKSRVREVAAERDRLAAALSAATDRAEMEARTANEWHALRLAAEARLRKVAELGKEWQQSEDRAWVSSLGDDVMDVLTQQSARLAVLAAPPAAPEAAEAIGEIDDHVTLSFGVPPHSTGRAPAHAPDRIDALRTSGYIDAQGEYALRAPVSSGEAATGEAGALAELRALLIEQQERHTDDGSGRCQWCDDPMDECDIVIALGLIDCPAPVVAPSAEEPAEGGA